VLDNNILKNNQLNKFLAALRLLENLLELKDEN